MPPICTIFRFVRIICFTASKRWHVYKWKRPSIHRILLVSLPPRQSQNSRDYSSLRDFVTDLLLRIVRILFAFYQGWLGGFAQRIHEHGC